MRHASMLQLTFLKFCSTKLKVIIIMAQHISGAKAFDCSTIKLVYHINNYNGIIYDWCGEEHNLYLHILK